MKTEIKKKKILYLTQVPPPTHGSNTMNKLVLESKLINESYDIKHIPMQFAKDINDVGIISFKKIQQVINVMYMLIKQLVKFKPDLVYFTIAPIGVAFYRDVIYIFIIKLFSPKLLLHLHGKGICENNNKNFINKRLYKYIFNNTHVICLSQSLISDIDKISDVIPYVVNNGIPLVQLEMSFNNNRIPRLLYLSNLDISKGILDLIDAVEYLTKNNIQFELNIIGSSSVNMTIEKLKQIVTDKVLSDFVNVLGPVYGAEKYNYMNNSDIFIFPTFYKNEAFPLVILEAMQCALPVVSTCEGGIPDIIDDGITGFLVEKNNPIELADKIEVLINNPDLRKQMGEAGRKKFFKKYTLEVFEQNMKNVFDDILKKSK